VKSAFDTLISFARSGLRDVSRTLTFVDLAAVDGLSSLLSRLRCVAQDLSSQPVLLTRTLVLLSLTSGAVRLCEASSRIPL
jgi:hypothetical protein